MISIGPDTDLDMIRNEFLSEIYTRVVNFFLQSRVLLLKKGTRKIKIKI